MKTPDSSTYILHVNYEDFDQQVLKASYSRPVLVDFWAEWCSPCLIIAPILETLATELAGEILLAKLEVDEGENMKLAGHYRVRGFPTVMLFREGNELGRFSGAKTKTYIHEFINELI